MQIFNSKDKQTNKILSNNIPYDDIGFLNVRIMRKRRRELNATVGKLFDRHDENLPKKAIKDYINYFGISNIIDNLSHHIMVFNFYINIMSDNDEYTTFSYIDEGVDLTKVLRLSILVKQTDYSIAAEKTAELLTSDEWELFKNDLIESSDKLFMAIEVGNYLNFIQSMMNKYKTRRVVKLFSIYNPLLQHELTRYKEEIDTKNSIIAKFNSRSYGKDISNDILETISNQGVFFNRPDHIDNLKADITHIFNNTAILKDDNNLDRYIVSTMAE